MRNFIKKAVPVIIFLLIAIIFCSPILNNINNWGQMDWDQFTFWNAIPRETILKYHQFPLWNPYANGGNVLLAHPQSQFLSPFYLFVLIWGPVIGLKLELIFHLFAGLLGMFFLGKQLKLSKNASYFSSFIFMLSSIYPLHLTEGHVEWMAMAFIPWAFLFYIKSLDKNKFVLGTIISLALMIFSGVYIFNVFAVFLLIYAALKSAQAESVKPLIVALIIFAGTFFLTSIKLIPLLEFIHHNSVQRIDHAGLNLRAFSEMLWGRGQALLDIQTPGDATPRYHLSHGWHEYGSYVGILPCILFLAGAFSRIKKNWPLLIAGIFSLCIVFGYSSPINFWRILQSYPIYRSLHVPSRFICLFIFTLSIFAGFGFQSLTAFINSRSLQKFSLHKIIPSIIILFILIDLFSINSPIFKNAFRLKPIKLKQEDSFAQRYDFINFFEKDIFKDVDNERNSHSSQYPIFLSNSGILDAYECVQIPKGDVQISSSPDYRGEAFWAHHSSLPKITYFSPNKITVQIDPNISGVLVLNQNFYKGWKVIKNKQHVPAQSFNGLISADIPLGTHFATFYFSPFNFTLGKFITGLSLLIILIYILKFYF